MATIVNNKKYGMGHSVFLKDKPNKQFEVHGYKAFDLFKITFKEPTRIIDLGNGLDTVNLIDENDEVIQIIGRSTTINDSFRHYKGKTETIFGRGDIETLETAQIIGLFLNGKQLLKDLESFDSNNELKTYWIDEIKNVLNIGYDWCEKEKISTHIEILTDSDWFCLACMMAGMTNFYSTFISSEIKHPYITHGKINTYYKLESDNIFTTTTNGKTNTTDFVISSCSVDVLLEKMADCEITKQENGICCIDGELFVQISLKKFREAGATQLGKFYKMFQIKHGLPTFHELLDEAVGVRIDNENMNNKLKNLSLDQQQIILDNTNNLIDFLIAETKNDYDHITLLKKSNVSVLNKLLDFSDVIKLFGNFVTAKIFNQVFCKDRFNVVNELVEIQKEMYFGKTNLPLFKVYGAESIDDENTCEYLGDAYMFQQNIFDKFLNDDKDHIQIGLRISNRKDSYYFMEIHLAQDIIFGSMNYTFVRTGSNMGSKTFSYVLEGVTTLSTEQFNKKYEL